LIVNPRTYRELFKRKFEHAIFDCGVEIFHRDPNRTEYPRSFLHQWKHKARHLAEIFGDHLWVTIPDHPDDYHMQFKGANVEKTLRNVEEFLTVDGVNWLVPLQSQFLNPFSFAESCQRTKELIGDYPRIAIGTVCKTRNLKFIAYCCRMARRIFPDSHIHAFGLTLRALPRVIPLLSSWDSLAADPGGRRLWLDSWDSDAYTFPRGQGRGSCKNEKERVLFFYAYIQRIKEILEKGEPT